MYPSVQLLSKTIRGNLKLLEEPRKESGEVDDVEDSSQQSAIVSADRDATTPSLAQVTLPTRHFERSYSMLIKLGQLHNFEFYTQYN